MTVPALGEVRWINDRIQADVGHDLLQQSNRLPLDLEASAAFYASDETGSFATLNAFDTSNHAAHLFLEAVNR